MWFLKIRLFSLPLLRFRRILSSSIFFNPVFNLIFFLEMISWPLFVHAQDSVEFLIREVPITLTLGSTDDIYKLKLGTGNNNSWEVPQTNLFLDAKVAHLTFLGADRIRIEFQVPIHILLFGADNENAVAEKVFRSFVVQASRVDIEKIKQILGVSHILFDSIGRLKIEDFIADAKNYGFAELIRELLNKNYPPELRRFRSLQFFIPVDRIGTPEGAPVPRFNTLSSLDSRLSWSEHSSADAILQRSLRDVEDFLPKNHALVQEYLELLREIDSRKQQLEYRGWLKPLMLDPDLQNSPDQNSSVHLSNTAFEGPTVIPLRRSCVDIFRF